MPFVRIFEVPLVYHALICVRDLSVNRYGLEYGGLKCWMTPTTAHTFGYVAKTLRYRRAEVESRRREKMRPGYVFSQWLPTIDGKANVLFEIGVTDNGEAIYFGIGDDSAELGVREGQFLQALYWLLDDVASINEAAYPRNVQLSIGDNLSASIPELAPPAWADDSLWDEQGRRK
jgi:hypothetical protein